MYLKIIKHGAPSAVITGFDRCFVVYTKQNQNNMAYFTHIGTLILQNIVRWFVYQNESGKENYDLLTGQVFFF